MNADERGYLRRDFEHEAKKADGPFCPQAFGFRLLAHAELTPWDRVVSPHFSRVVASFGKADSRIVDQPAVADFCAYAEHLIDQCGR
jgi:hypothetical protein